MQSTGIYIRASRTALEQFQAWFKVQCSRFEVVSEGSDINQAIGVGIEWHLVKLGCSFSVAPAGALGLFRANPGLRASRLPGAIRCRASGAGFLANSAPLVLVPFANPAPDGIHAPEGQKTIAGGKHEARSPRLFGKTE